MAGSPALDAGDNTLLPMDTADLDGDGDGTETLPMDQRGEARISNTTVDIGAFELQPPPNQAPVAADDGIGDPSFTTDEDTAFTTGNVLDNDGDPDEVDTLTITSIDTTGTLGTVTDNGDGTFNYDPNGQFESLGVGEITTDTFTYIVDDGNGGTDTATVTITIEGVNDLDRINDYTTFSQILNGKEFTVELITGEPIYQIDNVAIPNQSVNDFLNAVVAELGGTTTGLTH